MPPLVIDTTDSSSVYDVEDSGKNSPVSLEKQGTLVSEGEVIEARKYSHSFWDAEVAPQRKLYFMIMGTTTTLLFIVCWVAFIIFWGSYDKTVERTTNLRGWMIDMDGSSLGAAMINATEQNIALPIPYKISWDIIDASTFKTYADIPAAIIDEQAWVAVVVEAGATAAFVSARENGDASYSGAKAISMYYNEGRNEVATDDYVVPYATGLISQGMAMFAIGQAAEYIATQSGNATAMANLAKAPQTIAAPVGFTSNNLRPYNNPVSGALIGPNNIWVIILAFFVTVSGWPARQPLEPLLKTKTLLKFRLIGPALLYIPISLVFTMVNLPFKVPFGAKYTYGGGFFVLWLFQYMNFLALGLAEEAVVTLVTGNYVSFFLPLWICLNVSVGVVPIAMQHPFFKYGFGFPAYNMSQATRTILFNTKSHLGLNAGVMLAWIGLCVITIPIWVSMMRKRDQKKDAAAASVKA